MRAAVTWGLVAAALVAGWSAYGAPGVLLALTATVFWLLLEFSRAMRALRQGSQAPVGHVDSAVMLHSKLRTGMSLQQVLRQTGSLGRAVGVQPNECYRWTDPSGCSAELSFADGRLVRWVLQRPDATGERA